SMVRISALGHLDSGLWAFLYNIHKYIYIANAHSPESRCPRAEKLTAMNNVEQHYSYQQFPPVALQRTAGIVIRYDNFRFWQICKPMGWDIGISNPNIPAKAWRIYLRNSSTEKNGVALSRTPLSLIIYDAQNPIMEQPHNATMSSCVIDEKQKTQAVFDGKNRYELVSNNDHEIVPSLCDESSSSVSSSDEDQFQITVQQVRAMAATLPGKVSKKALMYQTLLTAAMRYQFETENCRRGKPTKSTFEIPDWYSQPGPNREAISSHSRFYMDKNKIAYLNEISTINGTVDWKVLTREVLVDVYGSALGNYCATGKRGKKPPINRELLKGLHGMNFINIFSS
ncbi:hypothetical protein PV325_003995, partial [Microctonus aethiopoides]